MIEYVYGDILEVQADYICHQVNTYGVMGSGLALQIRNKYPKVYTMYRNYVKECKNAIGTCLICNGQKYNIVNCFTQNGISHTDRTTDYDAIKTVFSELEAELPECTIAVPYKYGCGLANGDWNIVENIFKEIFSDSKKKLLIVKKD